MYSIGAMKDEKKSRADLIEELQEARKQISELGGVQARHKQTEEEICFLSYTVEQSSEGMAVVDLEGNLTYANRAWVNMHGYESSEELIGQHLSVFHNREQLENEVIPFNEKAMKKGSHSGEVGHIRKDGTPFPTMMTSNVVKNEKGEIIALNGLALDITDRKRAEDRLQALHDLSLKLGVTIDLDDTLRFCVKAAIQNTALDSAGIYLIDGRSGELHMIYSEGLSPDFVAETSHYSADAPSTRLIMDGRSVYIDYSKLPVPMDEIRRSEGLQTIAVVPIQYQGKSIACLNVASHSQDSVATVDRTLLETLATLVGSFIVRAQEEDRRNRAEEALRESESTLRQVIDTSTNCIYVKDREGRYLLVNRRMADMHHTTPEALVGSTDLHLAEKWLTTDAEIEEYRAAELEVIDKKQMKFVPEEEFTFRDGTRRWFQTTKSPITLKNNQDCLMSVAVDITDYKRLQAQIAQSDRLASMGMLAAGVAHEINNPLAYVLFNLESLTDHLPKLIDAMTQYKASLEEHLGKEKLSQVVGVAGELFSPAMLAGVQEKFKDALGGTRRIRDTTRGLGTFSRVEKDRLVPVDLMHVIEVAVSMVFNEIKYRARLVKDYGVVPTVMASEGRLSQVFLNLLINAAHAIDEGDVENNEIRIRTWTDDGEICVEVRDTGKGIEPEHIERLFEPFFTTKEAGVGSGLGLAISKSIVEGYGGRIEVRSEPGVGSSFVVCLPVGQKKRLAQEVETGEKDVETEVRGRILVIDDEREIRTAIRRMLENYEVIEAGSGKEARQVLESDRAFDLILCDIMMPEVSGVDLHEWLVETYPSSAKQVVFITGGAFTPRTREYLSRVGNLLIEKPFETADFKKIVSELIVAARAKKG